MLGAPLRAGTRVPFLVCCFKGANARCPTQDVVVPQSWVTTYSGVFLPGATHRREVLALQCRLWAAQAELAAAEVALPAPAPRGRRKATAASAATTAVGPAMWVVDFRRMETDEAAMSGAIPVVSLEGKETAIVPAGQAALLRSRSTRLQDALRVGVSNHMFWRAQGRNEVAALAGCAPGSEEAGRLDAQRLAFVDSPGGLECKCCCYVLDTYDDAALHRQGPMASQLYVGLVGVKEHANGDVLNNTLRRRTEQHRGGLELLVDMELHNPHLQAPAAINGVTAMPPPALLLALDWGLPGLSGEHSVGALEGRYIRYFDALTPLGLNAGCTAPHGLARGELDPVRGTSCHWCRQKTDSLKVKCSECPIAFCQPCLLIRHGLRPDDIGPDWRCPKCCGNCNCSVCRRKAGLEPTGVMGAQALAAGFAGVEQFLAAAGDAVVAKRTCRR